jgi:two-component sensor histidine kinase
MILKPQTTTHADTLKDYKTLNLSHNSDCLRERVISTNLGPTAILLMAVVVIWFATNHLVSRHIRSLSLAARQWNQGRTETRPMLSRAPSELAELGATFTEMADRIAAREAELQTSLAQKEVLLKEVHHRVKNNLQIVSSLLSLRTRAIQNPTIKDALEKVQTRIKALALVHRSLYEQEGPTSVDIERFLTELCQLLADSGAAETGAVEIRAEVAAGRVAADRATPIALLVTESVSNALRHGFPAGRAGVVTVRLEREGSHAKLSIADDGIGGAGSIERDGIGLTLCRLLAKQLGGELRIEGPPGTRVSVAFTDDTDEPDPGLQVGEPDPTSNVEPLEGTS